MKTLARIRFFFFTLMFIVLMVTISENHYDFRAGYENFPTRLGPSLSYSGIALNITYNITSDITIDIVLETTTVSG